MTTTTEQLITAGMEVIREALEVAKQALPYNKEAVRHCLAAARRICLGLDRFAVLPETQAALQRGLAAIEAAQRQVNLLGDEFPKQGSVKAMFSMDCGHGFTAVPYDAVTLNGIYMQSLNRVGPDYSGALAVVAPNGKVLMGEDSKRPYRYTSLAECQHDAEHLQQYPELYPEGHVMKRTEEDILCDNTVIRQALTGTSAHNCQAVLDQLRRYLETEAKTYGVDMPEPAIATIYGVPLFESDFKSDRCVREVLRARMLAGYDNCKLADILLNPEAYIPSSDRGSGLASDSP